MKLQPTRPMFLAINAAAIERRARCLHLGHEGRRPRGGDHVEGADPRVDHGRNKRKSPLRLGVNAHS